MFAGYNNDYRESKDNYNRKSMLPLLKCQITPLGVITHRLGTTELELTTLTYDLRAFSHHFHCTIRSRGDE